MKSLFPLKTVVQTSLVSTTRLTTRLMVNYLVYYSVGEEIAN